MASANEGKDLQLGVGETLLLQFSADETQRKHPTKVLGYLQGKSLIVTTPRIDGKVMLVREGQPVVVRMLSGKSVYAFSTQILATSLKPYAHLHLTYPEEIEKIVVRKAMRVTADLETTVNRVSPADAQAAAPHKARIKDISTAGALLVADSSLGGPGELLSLTLRIPVAGVQKYIKVPGVIRSLRESAAGSEPAEFQYGIEFQLMEEMDNILLHGFVYEQLQRHAGVD